MQYYAVLCHTTITMNPYDLTMVINILIAALLGGLVGFERERSMKPAGIRTQMLICVGTALLAGVSINIGAKYGVPNADPARLIAQIVSGIGFLGAGVIIKGSNSRSISGVTTAATIWVSSAIGIAVGSGFYIEAVLGTFIVLCLHPLARMKHLASIRVENYSIVVREVRWKRLSKILHDLRIEYEFMAADTKKTHLKIHTTQAKSRKLAAMLQEKKIDFEISDYDQFQALLG